MSNLLERLNKRGNEITLGEVVTFHRGYDLPVSDIKPGKFPVVFSNDRKEYHNDFKVKGPGVYTGRSGSLGGIFYIEENYWPHNTTLFVSDFHGNDPKFCYYFLKSFNFSNFNAGTGVPTLNRNHIHGIPVKIPDLPTQKKIAEILGSYDAKIENNNLIIKNLEATAQAIFNEWFVNFRFPGHEKVKMVDSELGLIPAGWEVGKIEDLVRVESGFPFSSSLFDTSGQYKLVTIRNVQDGAFVRDSESRLRDLPKNMPDYCYLSSGDILLSLTGNVGRVCLVEGDGYVLNQRVARLIPKSARDIAYAYFLFRDKVMQNTLVSISKGTAQQNLSPVETRELEVVIPPMKVLESYSKIGNPIYSQIVLIRDENQKLKASRDQLLKKLI